MDNDKTKYTISCQQITATDELIQFIPNQNFGAKKDLEAKSF